MEFFVLYCDGEPAACGGAQFFDGDREPGGAYGEVKRMYVRSRFRGRASASGCWRIWNGWRWTGA